MCIRDRDILALQDAVGQVTVEDSVARYILAIITGTRRHDQVQLGASPRGALSFYEACQAWALVDGRDYVTPGDVKLMAVPALAHRVLIRSHGGDLARAAKERARVVTEITKSIEVPV